MKTRKSASNKSFSFKSFRKNLVPFLIITGLVVVVVVTLFANQIKRIYNSEAASGDSTSQVPDGDYLYINSSIHSTYPQLRYESASFNLGANVDYDFYATIVPYNLQGTGENEGVRITLTCNNPEPQEFGGGCYKTDGTWVPLNSIIEELRITSANSPQTTWGKIQTTPPKSLRFNQPNPNVAIRIFASKGSEIAIDEVKLYNIDTGPANSNLIPNGAFDGTNLQILPLTISLPTDFTFNDSGRSALAARVVNGNGTLIFRNRGLYNTVEDRSKSAAISYEFTVNQAAEYRFETNFQLKKRRTAQCGGLALDLQVNGQQTKFTKHMYRRTPINRTTLAAFNTNLSPGDQVKATIWNDSSGCGYDVGGYEIEIDNFIVKKNGTTMNTNPEFNQQNSVVIATAQPNGWYGGTNNFAYSFGSMWENILVLSPTPAPPLPTSQPTNNPPPPPPPNGGSPNPTVTAPPY